MNERDNVDPEWTKKEVDETCWVENLNDQSETEEQEEQGEQGD